MLCVCLFFCLLYTLKHRKIKKRGDRMRSYRIKPWEELSIRDDYMFKLIMSRKRICKKVLERILHIEISDIHYLEAEKPMKSRYQSKGVRLDVYVRDDANTVYNIEMQVRQPEGDGLAKRTRYYQSMIDADLLAAGADYDELNQTIIIFICPFDPFERNRCLYTFETLCKEDTGLPLNDGATKIFLNTKGTADDVSDTLKAFLGYVNGVLSSDALVQEIDDEIQKVKTEEGERVEYMTFAMKMRDEWKAGVSEGRMEGRREGRLEGRKEGRLEGRKEGAQQDRTASLRSLIAKLKISDEQAMDLLEVPHAERPMYRALLGTT